MNIYLIGMLVTLIAYVVVGAIISRSVKSANDYYVAGRNSPTILITGSLVASFIGVGLFMGDVGEAYSGFFAGRGFDELGEGHALLVSVEEGVAKTELLTTAADRFECLTADMTGATSGEEVRARTAAFLQEADLPDTVALRLLRSGNVGLACRPDAAALAALGQRFALFEVIDQTMPILDADYLSKDPTLRGAFYRALLPRLSAADAATRATAAEALRLGLAALAGKEV